MTPISRNSLLVIEDDDLTGRLIRVNMERAGFRVMVARTAAEGLQLARQQTPELIITDAYLPDMDGLHICRALVEESRTRHIPILFISGHARAEQVLAALEHGADDYLVKPFDYREMAARVRAHIRRAQLKPALNPLSGLPGNLTIEHEIRRLTEAGAGSAPFAVLYIDLNNFKSYNDVYGFPAGDEMLHVLANAVSTAVLEMGNDSDLVGHIGGDDFIGISTPERSDAIAQRIIADFDRQVPDLYTPVDRRRGYIIAKDRQGMIRKFPMVGVVIAIVHNEHRPISSHWEVGEVGAELKAFAKTRGGSVYVKDKRRG